MNRRRCAHCGRFLGRYLIVAPHGDTTRLACPPCGPKVDGGQIQADANRQLRAAAQVALA
jgi:hypothetical protein